MACSQHLFWVAHILVLFEVVDQEGLVVAQCGTPPLSLHMLETETYDGMDMVGYSWSCAAAISVQSACAKRTVVICVFSSHVFLPTHQLSKALVKGSVRAERDVQRSLHHDRRPYRPARVRRRAGGWRLEVAKSLGTVNFDEKSKF